MSRADQMYRAPIVQSAAKAGACEDRVWHAGNKDMASENSTWGPRGSRRVPLPGPGRRSRRAASLLGVVWRCASRRAERRAEQEPAYPERQNDQRHSNGPHAAGQSGLAGWYAAGAEQSARRIEPCCTPPSRCSQGPPPRPGSRSRGQEQRESDPEASPARRGGRAAGRRGPCKRAARARHEPRRICAARAPQPSRPGTAPQRGTRRGLHSRFEAASARPRGPGARVCGAAPRLSARQFFPGPMIRTMSRGPRARLANSGWQSRGHPEATRGRARIKTAQPGRRGRACTSQTHAGHALLARGRTSCACCARSSLFPQPHRLPAPVVDRGSLPPLCLVAASARGGLSLHCTGRVPRCCHGASQPCFERRCLAPFPCRRDATPASVPTKGSSSPFRSLARLVGTDRCGSLSGPMLCRLHSHSQRCHSGQQGRCSGRQPIDSGGRDRGSRAASAACSSATAATNSRASLIRRLLRRPCTGWRALGIRAALPPASELPEPAGLCAEERGTRPPAPAECPGDVTGGDRRGGRADLAGEQAAAGVAEDATPCDWARRGTADGSGADR